ncbi:hypothetical protein B0J12DRAFT_177326 [Macrophomina phaseolina]|uniref:Uncharacterized protein n=1 Tax=Macrophomina phaseolina TaxID=35725 RepID=A0ABQ8GT40_9PEZI|nr:hypothetical protein B0J12DRAFT_177326 [Macrophomina phaseolina]
MNATLPGRPMNSLRCGDRQRPASVSPFSLWQLPPWPPPSTSCCYSSPLIGVFRPLGVQRPPAGAFVCRPSRRRRRLLLCCAIRAVTDRQHLRYRQPHGWDDVSGWIGAVPACINNCGPAVGGFQRLVRNRRELNRLVHAWLSAAGAGPIFRLHGRIHCLQRPADCPYLAGARSPRRASVAPDHHACHRQLWLPPGRRSIHPAMLP